MSTHPESDPPVTFLLPVRNGMPFLPRTLASIEAQSYRNWEILVWDNGSTDGTVEELQRWIPGRLPGRCVFDRPMSLGNSAAALVSEATTELCARIDADDISLPTRIEKQVRFLQAHPAVGLLGARCSYIDADDRVYSAYEFPLTDADLRWQMRWMGCFYHAAVMFRRSVALRAGNYRDLQFVEDFELFFRMCRLTEVSNLPEILAHIRKHKRNTTAGIRDYEPYFDAVLAPNGEILFDGIGAGDAIALRRKLIDVWALKPRVAFSDLFLLRKAAVGTARAAAKPSDYFRKTDFYRKQRNCVLRRLIAQAPMGRTILAMGQRAKNMVRQKKAWVDSGSGRMATE